MNQRGGGLKAREFICALCGQVYEEPGFCKAHPDEPLLDTGDEEVVQYLEDLDTRAMRKTLARGAMIGAVVGVVLGAILMGVTAPFYLDSHDETMAELMGMLATGFFFLGTALGTSLAYRRIQFRFRRWTRQESPAPRSIFEE